MLVAQVEREPNAVAGFRRVGDAGAEGVDPAFGQHLGEDARRADEVLLAFGVEPRLGASHAHAVAHGNGLSPDGGSLADERVQPVGAECFADGFGMVDKVLDFGLHGGIFFQLNCLTMAVSRAFVSAVFGRTSQPRSKLMIALWAASAT